MIHIGDLGQPLVTREIRVFSIAKRTIASLFVGAGEFDELVQSPQHTYLLSRVCYSVMGGHEADSPTARRDGALADFEEKKSHRALKAPRERERERDLLGATSPPARVSL